MLRWVAKLVLFTIWIFISLSAAEVRRSVVITFETDPNADFYHIEWLKEKPRSGAKLSDADRFIEKVTTSPIRKQLPIEYRFFRMRTAAGGYYSRWGEVISLEKSTEKLTVQADERPDDSDKLRRHTEKQTEAKAENDRTVAGKSDINEKDTPDKKDSGGDVESLRTQLPKDDCCFRTVMIEGRPQKILAGRELPLAELTFERPLYYSLDGGEIKSYEQPLQFRNDGEHRLDIFVGPLPRQRRLRTIWFRVDNSAPVTTLGLFQPVIYDGGQLWITGTSRLELKSEDPGSGVAFIRYRFYKNEESAPEFRDYRGEFSLLPKLADIEQEVLFEFFAEDQNGNREKTKRVTIHIDTLAPRMRVAEQAPKGYHRLLLEEKSTPVLVEIYDALGKLVRRAETRHMLQFPKLPAGRYKAKLTDNFGNSRQQEFELKD